MSKIKIRPDGIIESEVEPSNWFRFEEPYNSPKEGPSYVSGEDVKRILEDSNPTSDFYRLRREPGEYSLTPVNDNSLVSKLTEHRRQLVMAKEYDVFISSTGGMTLGLSLSEYTPGV